MSDAFSNLSLRYPKSPTSLKPTYHHLNSPKLVCPAQNSPPTTKDIRIRSSEWLNCCGHRTEGSWLAAIPAWSDWETIPPTESICYWLSASPACSRKRSLSCIGWLLISPMPARLPLWCRSTDIVCSVARLCLEGDPGCCGIEGRRSCWLV